MQEAAFFDAVQDGMEISIDLHRNTIAVKNQEFQFNLSEMEKELFHHGGIASAFRRFGNKLFEAMSAPRGIVGTHQERSPAPLRANLKW